MAKSAPMTKAAATQTEASAETCTLLLKGIQDHGKAAAELMGQIGDQQKERLDPVAEALADLAAQREQKLEATRKVKSSTPPPGGIKRTRAPGW